MHTCTDTYNLLCYTNPEINLVFALVMRLSLLICSIHSFIRSISSSLLQVSHRIKKSPVAATSWSTGRSWYLAIFCGNTKEVDLCPEVDLRAPLPLPLPTNDVAGAAAVEDEPGAEAGAGAAVSAGADENVIKLRCEILFSALSSKS